MIDRRIAFVGIWSDTRYPFQGALSRNVGMIRGAGRTLGDAIALSHEVDNRGNMIHGEAPARILEFDRARSCFVSMRALVVEDKWSSQRIAEELDKHFDLVVFSAANTIRPGFEPGAMGPILRHLRADFIALGMGMQNAHTPTKEGMHPNLLELLDVCNERAQVFGVRGIETEKWLKSVGYTRARALGCPSLFVYPQNILAIRPPDPARVSRAVTAGYIQGRVSRALALMDLFEGFEAHYVMQDEMRALQQRGLLDAAVACYNDATGEVDRDVLEPVLEQVHRRKPPFHSYRWFQDTGTWRLFASQFDFYLGDRLHGGVAALQAGVPSAFMAEDLRVSEIADYFGIPTFTAKQATDFPLREIVASLLSLANISAMKDIYTQRLTDFRGALSEAGISHALPALAATGASIAARRTMLPSPSLGRRLKDLLFDRLR